MGHRGFGIAVLLALLLAGFTVKAAKAPTFASRADASLLLNGTVEIRPDGRVEGHSLDESVKLPPQILDLIARQIADWQFEPVLVDGEQVAARTRMSLRIVATPKGDGQFEARIGSVWFSGGADDDENRISVRTRTGLVYPTFAEPSATAGTVYVALKIGARGEVLDAAVEQVNLTTFGTEFEMAKARRILGNNTLSSVRNWTFNVPTSGDQAGKAYWIGVLPVKYGTSSSGGYSQWERYVPGPRIDIPWADADDVTRGGGIDALPEGAVALRHAGPKLRDP